MQMRALLRRFLRLWPLAAGLVCACLFAAPANAAVCKANTASTVTFTILDMQLAVSYSYGTSVNVVCTGAAGEAVTVCVRSTRSTSPLLPGLGFTFAAAQGSGTLDTTGRVSIRLPVAVALDGMPASGTASTSLTLQPIVLDWDAASYSCASTTRVQLPVSFPIKIVINNVCSIYVKSQMVFPNFTTVATGSVSATGEVSATCTTGTAYRIFLSAGNNNIGGLPTTRRMVNQNDPTKFLTYGLYTNAARTGLWGWTGNGSGNGVPTTQTGTGVEQVFNVYGKIDLTAQTVTAGFYSDIIIVSIAY